MSEASPTPAPGAWPAVPPPQAPQSGVTQELPELNTLWRRVFAYGALLLAFALAGYCTSRLTEAKPLQLIALAAIAFAALQSTLYMCGSTATDVVKLVQAVHAKRTILSQGTDQQ